MHIFMRFIDILLFIIFIHFIISNRSQRFLYLSWNMGWIELARRDTSSSTCQYLSIDTIYDVVRKILIFGARWGPYGGTPDRGHFGILKCTLYRTYCDQIFFFFFFYFFSLGAPGPHGVTQHQLPSSLLGPNIKLPCLVKLTLDLGLVVFGSKTLK